VVTSELPDGLGAQQRDRLPVGRLRVKTRGLLTWGVGRISKLSTSDLQFVRHTSLVCNRRKTKHPFAATPPYPAQMGRNS